MRKQNNQKNCGYSLIEMAFSLGIGTFVLLGISQYYVDTQAVISASDTQQELSRQSSEIFSSMKKSIGLGGPPLNYDRTSLSLTDQSFTTTCVNNLTEKKGHKSIRYCGVHKCKVGQVPIIVNKQNNIIKRRFPLRKNNEERGPIAAALCMDKSSSSNGLTDDEGFIAKVQIWRQKDSDNIELFERSLALKNESQSGIEFQQFAFNTQHQVDEEDIKKRKKNALDGRKKKVQEEKNRDKKVKEARKKKLEEEKERKAEEKKKKAEEERKRKAEKERKKLEEEKERKAEEKKKKAEEERKRKAEKERKKLEEEKERKAEEKKKKAEEERKRKAEEERKKKLEEEKERKAEEKKKKAEEERKRKAEKERKKLEEEKERKAEEERKKKLEEEKERKKKLEEEKERKKKAEKERKKKQEEEKERKKKQEEEKERKKKDKGEDKKGKKKDEGEDKKGKKKAEKDKKRKMKSLCLTMCNSVTRSNRGNRDSNIRIINKSNNSVTNGSNRGKSNNRGNSNNKQNPYQAIINFYERLIKDAKKKGNKTLESFYKRRLKKYKDD